MAVACEPGAEHENSASSGTTLSSRTGCRQKTASRSIISTPSVPAVQKDTIPDWAPMSTVAGQPQPVRRRTRGRDRLVTMSGVPRVPSAVSMAGASRKVETVASRAHGPAVLPCCLGHSVSKAVFVDRSDTSAQQHVAVAISGEAVRWRHDTAMMLLLC